MSQWAEVRHLHLVEKVPKKEIARRLQLDVKTVRRAVDRQAAPVRVSSPRTRVSIATATWTYLWVSTPTITCCALDSLLVTGASSGYGPLAGPGGRTGL